MNAKKTFGVQRWRLARYFSMSRKRLSKARWLDFVKRSALTTNPSSKIQRSRFNSSLLRKPTNSGRTFRFGGSDALTWGGELPRQLTIWLAVHDGDTRLESPSRNQKGRSRVEA